MSDNSLQDMANEHKLEQDYKRDVDQKHKWALGTSAVTRGQLGRRPAKPYATGYSRASRREVEFQQNKAIHNIKMARKHDPIFDTDTSASENSTEEEATKASTAPEPDTGCTYSYDAPRGPGKGSQVLGMALAKAVEKFETKVTEKLVKEEYEVISAESDEPLTGYVADEDDFQLL